MTVPVVGAVRARCAGEEACVVFVSGARRAARRYTPAPRDLAEHVTDDSIERAPGPPTGARAQRASEVFPAHQVDRILDEA